MRCFAVISSIALVLVHASDPLDPMADATQLHRRLLSMPANTLPADCSAACPDAASVFQKLQQKMATAMSKHTGAVQGMMQSGTLSGDGGLSDPEDLSKLMTSMTPMMKDIYAITFEDMCTNKASYQCMVMTHADKCMDNNAASMGNPMGMSDPLALASQFAPQLECFCDKCPESKAMVIDMHVNLLTATMESFSLLGEVGPVGTSTRSNGASAGGLQEDVTTRYMRAICPMVGMGSCFEANPNECSISSMMPGSMVGGMGSMGPGSQNVDSIAQLRAACKAAGVDITSGSPVTTTPQLSGSLAIGVTGTVWATLTLSLLAAM
jgi:hypothetical protein